MGKNIILMGPQGSGKGTQAKLLAKHYNIPHISTGDIFRAAYEAGTEYGKKAKEYSDRGELAPNDITIGIVQERLKQDDCKDGYILDGFPRNLIQAELLDNETTIDYVIELDIPDNISIERLSSRRQCEGCHKIYGAYNKTKKEGICDDCGRKTFQRDDDQPEAIKKRLITYHDQTEPLLEYYKPREIVHKVDGTGTPEAVFKNLLQILGE